MPPFKLFSQRQKLPKEQPDVYQYDELPNPFRVQVVYILAEVLGTYTQMLSTFPYEEPISNQRWMTLFTRFTRELGVFHLGKIPQANPYLQCIEYLQTAPTAQTLDFIDCAFHYIDHDLRQDSAYFIHMVNDLRHERILPPHLSTCPQW